ncbi:hypothetical protein BH09BAC1_BH09BAC1_10810 [soil metagenome]
MKSLLLAFSIIWFGNMVAVAQKYPIENADQLQQLVVSPDLAQLKLMIFDDTYVYAERFVYFAILQGLAKDKLPITIAQSVLNEQQGNNFEPKCRICGETKQAFSHYAQYGAAYNGTKNPYPLLASKNASQRKDAINTLVDKYTSAFSTLLELSAIEQERLQSALAVMRKK